MMDEMEVMKQRHSVRQYLEQPLSLEHIEKLKEKTQECNEKGGLHIQLITNEPKSFESRMAHYGKFKGVKNYIALIGEKTKNLEKKCGYYGEQLVILAQQMGLNTCWVALTYKKMRSRMRIESGETLVAVIAIGYGANQGVMHHGKDIKNVVEEDCDYPGWFYQGVACALLAPTALNQQKFQFALNGKEVLLKNKRGFYTNIDLGIVQYHFEIGAGKENFHWAIENHL